MKDRYLQKIAAIGIDPVTIVDKYADPECLPPMESTDVLCYLVLETSFYTKEQFKNFRSLEAYNQMVSGWITGVQGHIIADKFVVLAKIRHSQRMNDPLVSVWIITSKEGEISSAHCLGCKAGLGETCSHVASVLFYLEAWTKIKGKLACTQVKCTWILPSFVGEVNYARVSDIDFTSSKKRRANLDIQIENLSADGKSPSGIIPPTSGKKVNSIPRASNEEMATFYEELNKCKIKPVALSLVRPYSEQFVKKSRKAPTIPDLFDKKYTEHSYPELLKACSEVKLNLTPEEIKQIERDTVAQAKGTEFFKHRAGRIGASMSGAACHTNPALPSQSLIKSICYPSLFKVSTKAIEHGRKHEGDAIQAYEKYMKAHHTDFKIQKCGTFINQEHQFLHATPDFLCSCSCCGDGCGEVKCPYRIENGDFGLYLQSKSCCLEEVDGVVRLKRCHMYYDQVQQQLFTSDKKYDDFVVCLFNAQNSPVFVMERICKDQAYWEQSLPKLSRFWRTCVLPEILGRWYTRKCDTPTAPGNSVDICYCRRDTGQATVTCTNSACHFHTFHLCCLAIMSPIPNQWYCPHCRKWPEFKKSRGNNKSTTKAPPTAIANGAAALDTICFCKKKAELDDKLIECHNDKCGSGKYFHVSCLGYKKLPNNSKTTWMCVNCRKVKKPVDGTNSGHVPSHGPVPAPLRSHGHVPSPQTMHRPPLPVMGVPLPPQTMHRPPLPSHGPVPTPLPSHGCAPPPQTMHGPPLPSHGPVPTPLPSHGCAPPPQTMHRPPPLCSHGHAPTHLPSPLSSHLISTGHVQLISSSLKYVLLNQKRKLYLEISIVLIMI